MRAYNNPNRLPFFPTPYPGESLYSVLCRYHVRSGNATNRKTILQLFGVFGSLCSTLLLPSMLNCLKSWVDAESGINAEYIFRNNTAYSLCTLRNYHDYYRFFPNGDFSVPTFSKKDYRWPFRQCLIRHPSNKLRYCPACAAVQKKRCMVKPTGRSFLSLTGSNIVPYIKPVLQRLPSDPGIFCTRFIRQTL